MDFDLCALQFVEQTCLLGDRVPALDADVDLHRLLRDLDEAEYPYWRAAVISEARDVSARGLASRLSDSFNCWLPKQLGFDPHDPPTHSTLSRHWRYSESIEAAIEELGLRARYAALWAGAEFPDHLRREGWGVKEILNSEPDLDEKVVAIKHLVEERVAVMSPHLSFGRDPDAPAFKLPPAAFIAFFAHLALENLHANTGQRTMEWLDLPAPVPAADTVHRYARSLSAKDVDEMFGNATAALLRQEAEVSQADPSQEALEPPLHLAYDTTKVKGTATSRKSGHPACSPETIAHRRECSPSSRSSGEICPTSWGYCPSETRAISATSWRRRRKRPWAQKNVSFGDFSMATKPNAFAWPIPKEEIGAKNRDHPHEAFLTDMDVKERDLEKLGREFRDRWGGG